MIFVAVAFLVLVWLRLAAGILDSGFVDRIWHAIVFVSSVAWLLGTVMALSIIFNITFDVSLR